MWRAWGLGWQWPDAALVHQVAQELHWSLEELALLLIDDQPMLPQPLHHPLQVLLVLGHRG